MTRLILLTGFLGAGKTTLMKALLRTYGEEKIGVIVNEFGEINIDAKLVSAEGVEMAELSNGSIFCACIKDKFVDSLIEMSGRDISILFIEASGLADPASMGQILEGIKAKTKDGYAYLGSICVVDLVHFAELADVLPALPRQVEYAGAIIANKADLVSGEEMEAVKRLIREINPDAQIFPASYCDVNIKEVVSHLSPAGRESAETTNTFASRPQVFLVRGEGVLPYAQLEAFLAETAPHSYRIKGFAKTSEGVKEVSCVGADIQINPWDEDCETELVAISSVGMKLLSIILAAAKEHTGGRLTM